MPPMPSLDPAVALERVPNPTGKLERRWLGLIGQEGSAAGRRALLAAVQRRIQAEGATLRGVLLYNQDPVLATRLHRMCGASGILFLQQYAELHVAADYRARWLQGYYLREQLHLRKVPALAAGNIVISSTLSELVARHGARHILRLPSFADADFWPRAIAGAAREKIPGRVLYAGEGARRDCLETVLRAAALCRTRGQAVSLRLVGLSSGARGDCGGLAETLGISAHVSMEGRLDHAGLAREYAESSATILLRSDDRSSRACFPTRLGELLLAGGPVILSDIPDYNLELRNGVNALFVNPRSVEDVARGLAEAAGTNERNACIGAAGAEFARTRLSVGSYVTAVTPWLAAVDAGQAPRQPS